MNNLNNSPYFEFNNLNAQIKNDDENSKLKNFSFTKNQTGNKYDNNNIIKLNNFKF